MIFTVIAEDFGFVGGLCLLLLYMFLVYKMLRITLKSNNQFYTYISTGFIMMLVFHIFENIGAVTGDLASHWNSLAIYLTRRIRYCE